MKSLIDDSLIGRLKDRQRAQISKRLEGSGPVQMRITTWTRGTPSEESMIFAAVVLSFLGLSFSAIGVYTVFRLAAGNSAEGFQGILFGCVGLIILAIAYGFAFYREVLEIDADARTWKLERGFWPRSKTTSGDLSRLKGLQLGEETVFYKSRPRQVWRSRIVWKNESEADFVIAMLELEGALYSRDEALAVAERVAARFRIDVIF